MTLWTFGDSFTNNFIDYDLHGGIKSWYTQFKEYRGGTFPKIWAEILSEKLKIKLNNMAKGGSSNYDILFKFCESCHKILENDIVIIGWTFVTRFTHVRNNNFIPINDINQNGLDYKRETVEEIFINRLEKKWNEEIYSWMKLMNSFAENKKFRIFYWSADRELINGESIDFKKDKRFIFSEANEGMINYLRNKYGATSISDETNHTIKDGHLGEYGHIVMADKFYQHLNKFL